MLQIEPERILNKLLLAEIYKWEKPYREKLLKKNPNLPEYELENKISKACSRKFNDKFNKVIRIKLLRLAYNYNQRQQHKRH